jgi:hypothetical protein
MSEEKLIFQINSFILLFIMFAPFIIFYTLMFFIQKKDKRRLESLERYLRSTNQSIGFIKYFIENRILNVKESPEKIKFECEFCRSVYYNYYYEKEGITFADHECKG